MRLEEVQELEHAGLGVAFLAGEVDVLETEFGAQTTVPLIVYEVNIVSNVIKRTICGRVHSLS